MANIRDTRVLFGATIAIILLGLYAYAVIEGIRIAIFNTSETLGTGFSYTLETVGGLVSALVVAELAVTRPGDPVGVRSTGAEIDDTAKGGKTRLSTIVGTTYVLVWSVIGLAAYVVGAMLYPDRVKPLTDFGQTWLGLAVAGGYAYFGIGRES